MFYVYIPQLLIFCCCVNYVSYHISLLLMLSLLLFAERFNNKLQALYP